MKCEVVDDTHCKKCGNGKAMPTYLVLDKFWSGYSQLVFCFFFQGNFANSENRAMMKHLHQHEVKGVAKVDQMPLSALYKVRLHLSIQQLTSSAEALVDICSTQSV